MQCHRGGLLACRGHRLIALEQGAEVAEVRLPVPLTGNPTQLVGRVDLPLASVQNSNFNTACYILTYRCSFALSVVLSLSY